MNLRCARLDSASCLGFLLIAAIAVACSIQDSSLTTVDVLAPSAEACSACHVEIYQEWKASKHADAYLGEAFREQTFDYRVQACLPCHIPETVFLKGNAIRARKHYQEEGVTCIACHLIEGEHHGPFFAASFTPHATRSNPELYHAAALCGTCHQGTYQAWKSSRFGAEEPKTCQQCHMGSVRRKITQATGFFSSIIVALHDEHDMRRHTFNAALLPEEEAVEILIERAAPSGDAGRFSGEFEVRVRNLLPHSIPTGDYGFRKVLLTAEWLKEGEAPGPGVFHELYKDLDTQLEPNETFSIPLPLPHADPAAGERSVHVVLKRVDMEGNTVFIISEKTLSAAGGSATGGAGP